MTRILYASGLLAVGVLFVVAMRVPDAEVPVTGIAHVTHDGDGLHLCPDVGSCFTVRFEAVDAPEEPWPGRWQKQPGADGARDWLRALADGKRVSCTFHGKSSDPGHKRDVGDCAVDGASINEACVKAGWCWAEPQYGHPEYAADEAAAKAAGLGVWAAPGAVEPKCWRHPDEKACK